MTVKCFADTRLTKEITCNNSLSTKSQVFHAFPRALMAGEGEAGREAFQSLSFADAVRVREE